jgi:hypothetical protein
MEVGPQADRFQLNWVGALIGISDKMFWSQPRAPISALGEDKIRKDG